MSGLSDKKKKEFIEAFSLFDKDGDKKISEEELANVCFFFLNISESRERAFYSFFIFFQNKQVYRDLGGAPSSAQIKSMMRQVVNTTGDKLFMNQEEFLDFMQKQCEAASNQDQIVEAFRVMSDDVDGTGKVKVSELKNILTRVGQKFTEEEADMLIADAKQDTDDDMIDYKKFVARMMARP